MKRQAIDVDLLLRGLNIDAVRRGREWVALCPNPNHPDTKPSWRIKDAPGQQKHTLHHCWPCGLHGDAAALVSFVRKCSLAEALAWIDDLHEGLQARQVVASFQWKTMALTRRPFALPPGVVVEPLARWPGIVRAYAEHRGLTAEQVERWGVGYSVDGPLAGRIVLVHRDVDGRPLNYTARSFIDHDRKYLAADAKEGPDLLAVLGEQFWPPPEERDEVAVVEGGLNGYAIERAETTLPFAALDGSEPRPGHFLKIGSFKRVLIVTDPDVAGRRAASILANGLARHCAVRYLALESGEDAQSVEHKRGIVELRRILWSRSS